MNKQEITERIEQKAFQLGFHLFGVSKVEKLENEKLILQKFKALGYFASMFWITSNLEKRINPLKILPNARSIISVGINYYTNIPHSNERNTGKISRHAWGKDYHQIISERLNKLLEYMKEIQPITTGKIFVDSGNIMEKVWAVKSGIGWIGKNSLIISKKYGSWFLLGEIITNLELETDAQQTNQCGDCTLCIEACPTDAIIEPYIVDSRRCISYKTIEYRGFIPYKEGKYFGNWIYGCDICQEVCPWNKKDIPSTNLREFYPKQENIKPNLLEILRISSDEFNDRYDNSPLKRIGLDRLKRNAKIALRNNQK